MTMMKNDVKTYDTWAVHVNNEKAGGSMVRVVIYGEHKEETEGLEGMLRAILTEKQRWPVIHTYIGNLESYLHFVRGNPYLIMLVSVMGKKGAQTVRRIRENNPAASLIWLSDEGNALEFWKQRCTRGYKRYKETSGLIEWKECQIFHSIFT